MTDVINMRVVAWAARIARQSEEMIIIAGATHDHEMRKELLGYADRLNEQLVRVKSLPAGRPEGHLPA